MRCSPQVLDYLAAGISAKDVPPLLAPAYADGGVPACLDLVFNLTRPFMAQRFLRELEARKLPACPTACNSHPRVSHEQAKLSGPTIRVLCDTGPGSWQWPGAVGLPAGVHDGRAHEDGLLYDRRVGARRSSVPPWLTVHAPCCDPPAAAAHKSLLTVLWQC